MYLNRYVRNDPVNLVDPDGKQAAGPCYWHWGDPTETGRPGLGIWCYGAGGSPSAPPEPQSGGAGYPHLSKDCATLFNEFSSYLKNNKIDIPYVKSDGTTGLVDLSRFDVGMARLSRVTIQDDYWSHKVVSPDAVAWVFSSLRYDSQGSPYYVWVIQFAAHIFPAASVYYNSIIAHEIYHVGQYDEKTGKVENINDPDKQAEAFDSEYETWAYKNNKFCDPYGSQ